jgi:hypothetical protein
MYCAADSKIRYRNEKGILTAREDYGFLCDGKE